MAHEEQKCQIKKELKGSTLRKNMNAEVNAGKPEHPCKRGYVGSHILVSVKNQISFEESIL